MTEEPRIQYQSRTELTPLQNVSQLDSGLTTKEWLKICCKPSYRIRRLKHKGAVITLAWSYLITSVLFFGLKTEGFTGLLTKLQIVVLCLTLPIAGWLADVYFGRYKVLRFSMWTMWTAFTLATISSVVAQFLDGHNDIYYKYVYGIFMIVVTIGVGEFQANIIQFGIDQLHDASTNEITSFITWYVWTYCVSGYVVCLALGCVPKEYQIVIELVICIQMSVALISMFIFSHLLVKEPVTKNPFKLVYNVIGYAIKNKHPRCRSAFTYCEDELPSRIDFGKRKYGGPFTTEQVEDVKTFLRLSVVTELGSVVIGGAFATISLLLKVYTTLHHSTIGENISLHQRYLYETFKQTIGFAGVIVIPLCEFFFYPLFHRFFANIGSQIKCVLGSLMLIGTIATLMLYEVVPQHDSVDSTNLTGLNGTLTTALDYRWLAIPSFLVTMSLVVFSIGGIEFIASQAPYSMRGLITGTAYGMVALSAALGIAISIPFIKKLPVWDTAVISNRFWHALLLLITETAAGILLIITTRWYKKRKREDVLPNEHIFAERYYGRGS